MKFKQILVTVLLFGSSLVLSFPGVKQSASANPMNKSKESYQTIDAYLEKQIKKLNIPGAALVIVEGEQIVHIAGFGEARPGGEAPTPQTGFFIGSTTKSYTALAIMQLVEAGKVELDAPVQDYLPWFRVKDEQASAQITVRHLLNQTSGLPLSKAWQDLGNFDQGIDAAEKQARALAGVKLTHPVGSAFEYSNLNYNLLGLIIEAASGQSYVEYIQEQIFTPLEMTHSYTNKSAAQKDDLAIGHQTWFGFPAAVADLPVPVGSLPSGQLIVSAEDMGHYLVAHLNEGRYQGNQILSAQGLNTLHQGAVEAINAGVSMGYYAMGWYVTEEQGETILHHTGMCPDFYTYMALIPGENKAFALMINANHFMGEFYYSELGDGITRLLTEKQPAPAQMDIIPWIIRVLLLIPILQIFGVWRTLRKVHQWQKAPQTIPDQKRLWKKHLIPSMLLNLIPISGGLAILTSQIRGFLMLFMPDVSWLAILSGGLALGWSVLRTAMFLKLRKK